MTNIQKELIAIEVIRTLYSQFDKFPEGETNNRNAPFHEAFLNAFSEKLEGKVSSIPIFISLASWMHGLNTSLGQSFLEKTAHIISNGDKREFKGLRISKSQQLVISEIIADLKNNKERPDIQRENSLIFETTGNSETDIPNFTADIFIEDDDKIIAIESKTVKPNSGIFKNEKEKILYAKSALKRLHPNKEIYYYLGFPFDPLSATPTGYNKSEFMKYSVDFKKYFSSEEFLLSAELWDFLSGETQTMESIIEIINTIATVDFKEKFDFFQNNQNKNNRAEYIIRLQNWYLLREKALFENQEKILSNIKYDKPLIRIFNQNIFNNSGDYNEKRCTNLQEIFKLEVKQLNVINSVDYPDIDRVVQIKKKS